MRNVPKLRFKEFTDEWEKLNAEKIFKNVSNKNHNGDLPILAVTQNKGVVYRDSLDLTINSSEKGIKSYKIIEPGDFIISLRSFQGGIEYSNLLGISSPAYTVLKSKIRIYDSFYKFYLKKESFISELNSTIEGIRDGKQISYSMFSKLKLPYTTFEEQEKIGNFLLSIDKKISITEEKLNLFEEYKKGIMQKIFNQELRFKDSIGNDYPEWEEKKLEEITSYVDYRGKTPEKTENGVFLVTAKNIKMGYIDYTASQEFVSSGNYDEIMKRGKPKIGDVLLTTEAPLGNVAQIDKEDIALAQRVIKFRGKEDLINNTFLKYAFLSDDFQNKLKNKAIGTTVLGIQGKVLHKLSLNFPISLIEQQKIADFLSSIDTKIEKISDELENLKEFKKGLLQQMFV